MADTPASFRNWYDASKQLTESIQRYLDASLALDAAVTCPSENGLDINALDRIFTAVRAEILSQGSRNDKILISDAAVGRVYNRSTNFVPVQRLPCELLVRIFFLACERCGFFPFGQWKISDCQTTKTMLTITHVCTDWRRLAIDTPVLWSHVDMADSYRGSLGHEQVWLERARSVPLSVQAKIDKNSEKLTLLGPHFGAIRSLGFESDSSEALEAALARWMSNCTPGSVQELSLVGPKQISRFGGPPLLDETLDKNLFASFIAPLKVLRLRRVEFISFIEYEELVHLELSHTRSKNHSPATLVVFWLCQSPKLRVLILDTIDLLDRGKNSRLTAGLDELERLEIIDVSPGPCSQLLPLLVPGPGELSLRLETEINPGNEGKLVSFLNRSNVVKLFFKLPRSAPVQMDWMTAIPNLRMLVLWFHGKSGHQFRNSVLETLISSTSRFPKLRALWVIDFDSDEIEVLKRVVETCRIETLIISVYSPNLHACLGREFAHILKTLILEPVLFHSTIAEWYSRAH